MRSYKDFTKDDRKNVEVIMNSYDLDYRIACTEVLEILKHMPKKQVEKIPKNVLISMQRSKRYDYRFKFDKAKSVNEQNISKTAKKILSDFYRDYWADSIIKKMILAKEKFDKKNSSESETVA